MSPELDPVAPSDPAQPRVRPVSWGQGFRRGRRVGGQPDRNEMGGAAWATGHLSAPAGALQEPAHPLPTPHLVAWAGVGKDRGFQKMPRRECSDSIREAILM